MEIKRISSKVRNQGNLPDKAEIMALNKYEKLFEQNQTIPDYYIHKVIEEGKEYFDYYKPLNVAKPCLTCHGNPEVIDAEILKILKESYPNDKATGYKEGDFRGLVRIRVRL